MAPRLTEVEKETIRRLLKTGKTLVVVAGLTGRARDTIKRIKKGM